MFSVTAVVLKRPSTDVILVSSLQVDVSPFAD
ncbi:uncharacterized protein METZ01_LOCUS52166 [marine metagenome]|uniref:Uncharacterized protein n=1 Tax=marine metagenome TaxID=408172 RepID=A0A381S5E3_9ZZZZ